MADSKNFAPQFLTKPASSRSLTDPVPEEEVEEAELPTPQLMIDSLYQILMKRLDEIEEKIDKLNG
jgi:tetrahydromethanopterin S-methyltransferase subunit G